MTKVSQTVAWVSLSSFAEDFYQLLILQKKLCEARKNLSQLYTRKIIHSIQCTVGSKFFFFQCMEGNHCGRKSLTQRVRFIFRSICNIQEKLFTQ